jgi:hypothetical protein
MDTVFNDAKEVKSAFGDGQLIPLYEFYVFGALAYAASDKFCVDCREYGGHHTKPDSGNKKTTNATHNILYIVFFHWIAARVKLYRTLYSPSNYNCQ